MGLEGARVRLCRPTAADRDEVVALYRASVELHRGLAAPPRDHSAYDAWLHRCKRDDYEAFLIRRIEDDAVVGSITISQIFHGNFQSAYLGYQIGAPYARRGYMTEALDLAVRHAFENLGLHRLEANVQPGNAASLALVRRAGFTREGYSRKYLKIDGTWRDHERWAILREDRE